MNTPRMLTAAALALALFVAGAALAGDPSREPGYVDLEWIPIPADAGEVTDIDLSPMLMSFAKDASAEGADALLQALAMVHSLRVKEFSVTPDMHAEITGMVDKLVGKLKKDDWKRLIYVKSEDETVTVHTRYKDDDLVGLMLVAYEPGESAVFVNVVGDLDLATLMKLAGEIDTGNLEAMLEEFEAQEAKAEAEAEAAESR
jgi:hypothetical protein